MKYTYVTNYKNNVALRKSFNELTEKTFCFNFVDWYNNGFWGGKYIPCSLADGETVVANVSVNLMGFQLDGAEKHYIQIGTVMTDEAYRGQGLSRFLMEKVIADYKEKADGIYLFGSDSVLKFYPKFGFTGGTEYQYSKTINAVHNEVQADHLNMADTANRHKLLDAIKSNIGHERLSMDNFSLYAFWITGSMSNMVYYHPDEDAYIIAEIQNENLNIHQILSAHKVSLEKIIHSFGNTVKNVTLGFTPINSDGYTIKELHKNDCTFFYLGKDLESVQKKKLRFPTLSHA